MRAVRATGRVISMAAADYPAEYYRDQAKRTRRRAESATLPDVKEQLLMIAEEYDDMARQREGDRPSCLDSGAVS
jgi:hypothetical protein